MDTIQPLRLSQLTTAISGTLTDAFSRLAFWIVADVTNHSFRADKNYHSFDLVEKDPAAGTIMAKMQAKAWGRGASGISTFQSFTGQRFGDNIQVLVNVSVSFHAVYGLQLNVNEIDSNYTLGMLEQQRRATLARLLQENPSFIRKSGEEFITANKELSFKKVIQRIAVVSSKTSAGWQDFRHTLDNNPFGYQFAVDDYFTIVQGENNTRIFLSRLIDVFHSGRRYDAVVIIRGGGAQTDFLLFDDYRIGQAVAKFPIPIITGIGHQKNETIVDLMAHTPTKTPTKAAEFIINHNHSFEEAVNRLQKGIIIRSQQKISAHKDRLVRLHQLTINQSRVILTRKNRELHSLGSSLATRPKMMVYNRLNDIRQIAANLALFSGIHLKHQGSHLAHFFSIIKIASPENTLRRGFAIIRSDNKIISNPEELVIGKDIEILLSNKAILSTVKSKKDYDGNDFNI